MTLIEMGGEDCVSIVGKLIQPIKGIFTCGLPEVSWCDASAVGSGTQHSRPEHDYFYPEHVV